MAERAERGAAERARLRAERRDRWESLFSPWAAAGAGAAISLAFLFQRSLPLRAAMFLLFFTAAGLAGKRVSALATIFISAGIVAANLVVPVGRVLAQIGPFKITETALLDGAGKALVFEGLICLSKASILPGLRLPGRFGALVAAAFVSYDRIVEYKGSVRPATLVADVDRLMLFMWEEPARDTAIEAAGAAAEGGNTAAEGSGAAPGGDSAARRAGGRMKPLAAAALAAAVIAAYLPLILKL
jgi:hypothetical protein